MLAKSHRAAAELRAFASRRHRLIALSLIRICYGGLLLIYYAQHILQREYLWGSSGVVPFGLFRTILYAQHNLSLYLVSSSPWYEWTIFYLGFLVTIAFTLGYRTRISCVLFYVFTWSLFERNPFLLDGGDNLMYVLLPFLMLTNCGEYFSLDAMSGRTMRDRENPFWAMVHNYAVLAIVVQMCLLYFTSSFYKIQGKVWQDGTAIYYILRSSEFRLSPFAHHFYDSDVIVTLITWSTVVFQVAWPWLIWNRRTKLFVFLGAVSLHTMIGYFMGLVWFSAVMLTSELIIFDDSEYQRFYGWMQRLSQWAQEKWRGHTIKPATGDA